MPSFVKESMAGELAKRIQGAEAFFVTGYQGLKSDTLGGLRQKLMGRTARFMVVKNTVARKVFKEQKMDALSDLLEGPSAVTLASGHPEEISKILADFAKANEVFQIQGAYVDGQVWDRGMVKRVAALPSREMLVAQAIGQIKAPISGFVGTLSGILRQLVGTLSAVQEKRAKEAGSSS